jgi:hypothetical protein
MLMVIWGMDGFHIVDLMTDRHSCNTHYFLSNVMEQLLSAKFPDGRKPQSRRLSVHLNNCRVRCSKTSETFLTEKDIAQRPRPVCGYDLAPSDFLLFRHMKGALAGQHFTGAVDLPDGVSGQNAEVRIGTCLPSLRGARSTGA